MILDQEWETAANYCRAKKRRFGWNAELYFLKKMGPRGYLLILKRAPMNLWDDFTTKMDSRYGNAWDL